MKRISLDRFRIGAVLGTKDTLRGNENESNDKVNGPTSAKRGRCEAPETLVLTLESSEP
jgi:hypothetical protein